jgi:hypothetical protein
LVRGNKDRGRGDNIDKKVNGFSTFICPDELGIGLQEGSDGARNLRKIWDKGALIS